MFVFNSLRVSKGWFYGDKNFNPVQYIITAVNYAAWF